MTLIVGVVCKDAIVMGAESETTRGNAKYQGTRKITLVDFAGGHAITGESGVQILSGAVVDNFSTVAGKMKIQDEDSVAKTLGNSFREISGRTIAPPLGTRDSQDFYFSADNFFEITLAFYCNGRPFIYIFNPAYGIAVRCRGKFSISGIGKDLAEYLLKDFPFQTMDSRSTVLAVAHVVREVKTSISGCGGNTEIALVSNGNKPEKLAPANMALIDDKIRQLTDKERASRMKAIEETMQKTSLAYQSLLPGDLNAAMWGVTSVKDVPG